MPRPDVVSATVSCFIVCVLGPAALGQQFADQTASRFPPDPLEYTNQCSVGDIDGDTDLDIVWANGGNFSSPGAPQQLRIYINNGAGVFTDQSSTRAPGALFLARGVEMGDCEGDGDLDLIVAQDFNRQPQLLINNGLGFFVNETTLRLPPILLSSSRGQFADVDNDGDLDIYLTNGGLTSRFGTGSAKLYMNNGSGVYVDESAARGLSGNITEPQDAIFGDIDNDFDLDLRVGTTASNQSKLYRNNGAGVFTTVGGLPADNNCYSYDFGDIDGDGDFDLFGANASGVSTNAELLLRNGSSATFGNYVSTTFPVNSTDDNDSKFIDYDMDGDMDIIVGSLGSAERAYTNNGTGTFTLAAANTIVQSIADASLDLKVADFDGDGRLDFITAQGESGNFTDRIYINSGPIDTRAPRIVRTEQVADTQDTDGPYFVRAAIFDDHTSDRGFHDRGVFLNYSVKGAGPTQVPMKWVGNSTWRAGIPGQAIGAEVSYFVTATDFNNNLGTGPTLAFSILHPPCPADTNNTGTVDVDDLLAVINTWGQANVTIDIGVGDFFFSPETINARWGDTLRWNWVEGTHTVTSGGSCTPDGRFNSTITAGMPTFQYEIPSDFTGVIPYYCIPHCAMAMIGTINVEPFSADVTQDGVVNVDDLLAIINAWGPCP